MPFIIESILPSNQKLATVTKDDSVQKALDIMIEHDFSQLLVVDQDGKLKGLITSDSVVKALGFFQVTLDQLKVSHAIVKVKAYRNDEDLSELLKGLRDINAVPIIDKNDFPKGIVTSFDTTEYFRTRAEDIMLAEDVETTLRDFIEACYKSSDGDIDQKAVNAAIEAITPSCKDAEKSFKKALGQYLGECGQAQNKLNQEIAQKAFAQHLVKPTESKSFEDLTLHEYIRLFGNVFEHYKNSFNDIDWKAIDKLLQSVRTTRNTIAHFREVTPQQREQLKFCVDFLDRHRPSIKTPDSTGEKSISVKIPEEFGGGTIDIGINSNVFDKFGQLVKYIPEFWEPGSTTESEDLFPDTTPPVEEIDVFESRYAPLAIWLQGQKEDKVVLSFEDVEGIIQDALPISARKHRNWWANDSVGHSQSQQWLEAGWRVSNINLSEEKVVFSRILGRETAYIDFFSSLQPKLQSIPDFTITPMTNNQGRHWFTFNVSSEGYPKTVHVISFARGSRLRLELYIDLGDRDRNKRIFEYLYEQKDDISKRFGSELSWERLVGKRGTRVAVYRENSSITDVPDSLAAMQGWLIETVPSFYTSLANKYQEACKATVGEFNNA
jgi:hypothetical protein